MIKNNEHDVERELGRLVPKSVPPGLRAMVLTSALEARRKTALTPRLRFVACVCMVLIIVVLGIEPVVGRQEAARLAALLDGRAATGTAGREAFELAEMAGLQGKEAARLARFLAAAASAAREQRQRHLGEALKGAERMVGI